MCAVMLNVDNPFVGQNLILLMTEVFVEDLQQTPTLQEGDRVAMPALESDMKVIGNL